MQELYYIPEVFKPIKGYEGCYSVSNFGRVFTHRRECVKGGFMKQNKSGKYRKVQLYKNGQCVSVFVHRLVYETFVGPIPEGMTVNHIDENPSNNYVLNLNLLTQKDNTNYGTARARSIETRKKHNAHTAPKPVLQYTKDGQFVKEYKSIAEAANINGLQSGNISKCCRGKTPTAGGSIWKYKNN